MEIRSRPDAITVSGLIAEFPRRMGRATMNKVILADSQAIFRAGTAKVLAMDEDMRIIAQCTDLDRMMHAIATFPGSIVVFAASLRPDMARLRTLLEATGSRGIVIAENNETASAFLQQGFRGVVFRNVTGPALVECVRRVAAGDTWTPPQLMMPESPEEDLVGARVRDRLTPKEMRIVALIVQGCKNREIATPAQDHRAGHQELSALHLRQDRRQRPPRAGSLHHPPPRAGAGRRRNGQQARSRRASRSAACRSVIWLRYSFSATLLACVNSSR